MEEESFLEQTPKTLGQMAAKFHVPADFFYREQPMETLSGGEKVKAQMMKLLLTEPTVLCWMNRPMTLMWRRWNG